MEFILYSLLVFMILLILCSLTISWSVHVSMTKENSKIYGWGNFKKFTEQFKNIQWQHNQKWDRSLFNCQEDSQIHASIIKFNGIGMVINNPIDYHRINLYVKKHINENFNKKQINYKW